MKLTVLGASGTYPRPGGATNGFLVQEGETDLVLDLGNGCLSNLLKEAGFADLDAVVVTHMHIDHFGDVYPLFFALRFNPDEPWGLRLLLPRGGLQLMGRILGEDSREYLPRVFAVETISEGRDSRVGKMDLSFYATRHPVEGYSVRLEGGGWTMAYSSDSSPCPGLEKAAAGADLFICEATLPASYEEEASHGHLTSTQAGEVAERAGVKRLLLTHIWPTFDPGDIVREVESVYGGEVELAQEGMVFLLGGEEHGQA
ncbi:MAG: MBL fold metallo-hydrolase [Actinobacteria bacterium]|nr:MAG: MBL fold metallo-hydrolase [Actinomycetota bacterium]